MPIPYTTRPVVLQVVDEEVNKLEKKVQGDYVLSNKGKKPIPNGQAIGGADSAFPEYNFVLGGCYQCAGDTTTDWMRPIVMGNNPNTAEQSFKYSIPIRDGHGRLFAYCGTQKFQAELEYEVCNAGAVKYLINRKTPDLPSEATAGEYVLTATKDAGGNVTYT